MASVDQRSRVIAAIGEIAAPTRRELVRRQVWLIIAGVAGALAFFWVEGGLRATGRPPSLVAWTSLGTSGFVGVGMWFLFTRGRSGLRRPWPALVLATLVPALAFVLWRYGFGSLYELASPWPTRPGYRCFAMSAATGGILLFAALMAWRRSLVSRLLRSSPLDRTRPPDRIPGGGGRRGGPEGAGRAAPLTREERDGGPSERRDGARPRLQ